VGKAARGRGGEEREGGEEGGGVVVFGLGERGTD